MMTRSIVLIGAGGFGREVLAMIRTTMGEEWRVEGFVDDAFERIGPEVAGAPVLGPVSHLTKRPGTYVACCIGDPLVRAAVVGRLAEVSLEWPVLVAGTAHVGERCALGRGTIICPGSVLTCDIALGGHVHVNVGCCIGHDARVEDFGTLAPHVNLNGGAVVGRHAYLGTGAVLLPDVHLGERSVLGAGAVANRDIPDDTVAVGVPARVIRRRPEGFNPAYVTASTRE